MKLTTIVTSIVLVAGLSACASKSAKDQCMEQDAYQLGLNAGRNGASASDKPKSEDQCFNQAASFDTTRYEAGRQKGIQQYCSNSKAKRDAKLGSEDATCATENVGNYSMAYTDEIRSLKTDKENEIRKYQMEQKKAESDLNKIGH